MGYSIILIASTLTIPENKQVLDALLEAASTHDFELPECDSVADVLHALGFETSEYENEKVVFLQNYNANSYEFLEVAFDVLARFTQNGEMMQWSSPDDWASYRFIVKDGHMHLQEQMWTEPVLVQSRVMAHWVTKPSWFQLKPTKGQSTERLPLQLLCVEP